MTGVYSLGICGLFLLMTLTNDRGLLTGSRKCGEVAYLGVRLHEVAAVRKEVGERCLRGEWERE